MSSQKNRQLQSHPGAAHVRGRLRWWVVFLLSLPLAALPIWAIVWPDSLAGAIGSILNSEELVIEGLPLKVEGRDKFIAPGGSLKVHPQAALIVGQPLSNRWRNYGLRLYSPDFDLTLATYADQPVTPAQVMGLDYFSQERQIIIEVKDGPQTVAVFKLISGFSALDWAARGDVAVTDDQRIEAYQKALALQADSPQVRRKLAEALAARGRLLDVAELWEEAFALEGGPQYLEQALAAYQELDHLEGQEKILKRLTEPAVAGNRPPDATLAALAALYARQAKWPEAERIYEQRLADAVERDNKSALLTELAGLYRQSGQAEKERHTWRRLLDEVEPGRKSAILSEIIRLSENLQDEAGLRHTWRELAEALPDGPRKAAAYKHSGFLEVKARQYPEARQSYQAALLLDPQDPNVYLNLARVNLALGLKDGYREHLEALNRLQPENYDYLSELVTAYRADGLDAQAEAVLRDFLSRLPDHQPARLTLIALLEARGDQAALLMEYEAFLKNAPEDKTALYNLGVLSHAAGRLDLARQAFEKLVALEPSDLDARGYLMAIYQAGRQDELVAAQARAVYELEPERSEARDLALAYVRENRKWPELAELAEKWLKISPGDPVLWRALSRANLELGHRLEAAENLRSAAELTPEQVEPWLWAGAAFEEAGRPEEAQKAYQKALNVAPQNAKASEALLRLNQRRLQGSE